MANDTPLTIIGNLTRDPEFKVTTGGDSMATFTVASTPRTFDRRDNQWRDAEPMYVDCVAWRHVADNITETLTKGIRVVVTGRLKQSHWEDKTTGDKRSRFVLQVDDIGPSLQFATATITKTTHNSNGNGNGGGTSSGRPDAAAHTTGPAATQAHAEPPF